MIDLITSIICYTMLVYQIMWILLPKEKDQYNFSTFTELIYGFFVLVILFSIDEAMFYTGSLFALGYLTNYIQSLDLYNKHYERFESYIALLIICKIILI